MEIFEFKMRTKILFGINCLSKLAEKIQELQVKNMWGCWNSTNFK